MLVNDRVQDWYNRADSFSILSYLEKYFIVAWILLWNLAEKSVAEFETVETIWKILKWNKRQFLLDIQNKIV